GGGWRVRRRPRLLQERDDRGDPEARLRPDPGALRRRRGPGRRRRAVRGEDAAPRRDAPRAAGGGGEVGCGDCGEPGGVGVWRMSGGKRLSARCAMMASPSCKLAPSVRSCMRESTSTAASRWYLPQRFVVGESITTYSREFRLQRRTNCPGTVFVAETSSLRAGLPK